MNQICPRCNSIALAGSVFCQACGVNLSVSHQQSKNNSLSNPVIILIAVISLCSICGFCGLLGNFIDKSKNPDTVSQPINSGATPAIRQLVSQETPGTTVEIKESDDPKPNDSKPDRSGKSAFVITENAYLRETANKNGLVTQTFPKGTVVEVIRQQGAWFYVSNAGQKGWMHGNTIKYGSADSLSPPVVSTETVSRPVQVKKAEVKQVNPTGATAKCRDGTLSYSASRRGTCSHHGGVAVWY